MSSECMGEMLPLIYSNITNEKGNVILYNADRWDFHQVRVMASGKVDA